MTVKFMLTRPEAPFIANLAMDFASILSAEYADAMLAAGTPEMLNQAPIGTGPFSFVAYQKDAVIRYAKQRRLLGRTPAEGRQPGLRDHHRRLGALPEAAGRRMPRHALPEPGRRRRDEGRPGRRRDGAGRPERRLPRLQHPDGAVRQRRWCARR